LNFFVFWVIIPVFSPGCFTDGAAAFEPNTTHRSHPFRTPDGIHELKIQFEVHRMIQKRLDRLNTEAIEK